MVDPPSSNGYGQAEEWKINGMFCSCFDTSLRTNNITLKYVQCFMIEANHAGYIRRKEMTLNIKCDKCKRLRLFMN